MKDMARRVQDLIDRTGWTRLQNTLMRIPDKVCSAVFAGLGEDQRAPLYRLLSESKVHRIREEMRLETRRRTAAAVRARLIRSFFAYFEEAARRGPKIWIRPIRRKE